MLLVPGWEPYTLAVATRMGMTGVKRVPLGGSEASVPNVVLGLMRVADASDDEVRALVRAARDAGIDFFDHADIYGPGLHACERRFAEALRLTPAERAGITIQSKAGIVKDGPYYDFSYDHLVRSVEGSLEALQTDYLDLYQLHWPDRSTNTFGQLGYQHVAGEETTPIEETLEALHDVVKAGKARYIGASSMHASQFAQALDLQAQHGWARFVTMQDHYNLIYREEENEMLPLCHQEGVAVIPWSPLARGRLTRPWGEDRKSVV